MAKRKKELEARNEEIYRLREGGLSMPKIGKRYGLGRERIRQIVAQVVRDRRKQQRLAVAGAAIMSGKSVEIAALNLDWRVGLALEGAGITHSDDLFSKSKVQLLLIRGMGRRSLEDLEDLFLRYGKWDRRKWL